MNKDFTAASVRKLFKLYLPIIGLPLFLFVIVVITQFILNASGKFDRNVLFNFFMNREFLLFILIGFISQTIDGALGMAYGLSATSFLISNGVSPAVASASTHISEVFTTGISGWSHFKFGNVNKIIFRKLVIPGTLGAALGAYFLSSVDSGFIKPFVSAYLLIMGLLIITKAFKKVVLYRESMKVGPLAFAGGFIDASGGGGWGPIVTSSLINSGINPKLSIGTVNAVEFFIAFVSSGVFTLLIGVDNWRVVAGLILGGIIAAPLGAYVCHIINLRVAMIMVGVLIIVLSIRTILISMELL